MEVILLTDVEKLGLRGDVVNVAPGYARNFLLPRRLAETASPGRVAEVRRHEERRARQQARTAEEGQRIAEILERTELRFDVKAGPTGALFGSVTPTDVADALWQTAKVRVDRRRVELPEPIKRIGRYEVPVEVFTDVTVGVRAVVVPEGGEVPPEEELLASVEEPGDQPPGAADSEPAEAGERLTPTATADAEQVPADAFDRAVDAGLEPEEQGHS